MEKGLNTRCGGDQIGVTSCSFGGDDKVCCIDQGCGQILFTLVNAAVAWGEASRGDGSGR